MTIQPDQMTDEELADLAQQGDDGALEYLLNKYKNFVRSKARSYFLIGADHEDIVQEGMIGLYKAINGSKQLTATLKGFSDGVISAEVNGETISVAQKETTFVKLHFEF